MPLPLPLGSSKHETKKSQSSKIVPSDHGQFGKRWENYQAKVSPSSPQGPLKKRSALEDLTNASQSQPAQPKKEANKEFVKDISKKINRDTPALGLAKNNEMNIKKYELEPSSAAVNTMVLTFVEKPLSVNISTVYKTPTTEEASLLKKSLVLKEKPNTGVTKRSLSFKKRRRWDKVSQFEEPLSLLEETESDLEFVSEPVTFRKKHKTDRAAFAKKTLSFTEMCTCQGKHSCCGKELTSLDINVDKESLMEPMNFRKKPETEEATSTKKLLTLNKCTTQENTFHREKPLILRKVTSRERFRKKPTTEEFLFQEPSLLQEKHTTQGEVSILKKPLAVQKTPTEEESLLKETLAFKKKRTIEETTPNEVLVVVKRRRPTADKISCLKKPLVLQTVSKEKSLIKEPLPFKKKPSTEEEFFKELSVLPEKHTTQGEMSILNKPLALQKTPTEEESLLKETLVFKKCTTEEAIPTKKLLFVKKKCATEDKISCLKKPLVLQTISEEKSLIKEPLSFKKKPSTEEEFFKELSVLPEKHTTQGEMSILNKPLALQKTPTEEESLLKETLVFKKCTTEEAIPTKKLLFVKKKCATEDKISCLKKPLVLQTISEEKSLIKEPLSFKKKPSTEEEFFKELSVLPEKHTTQGEVSILKKPLAVQKTPTEEESLLKETLAFKKKRTIEETTPNEVLVVVKRRRPTADKISCLKKPLVLQTVSKEKSLIKEPLPFKKKPSTEEEFFKELSVLPEKHTTQGEMSILNKPLALQKTPTEEESLLKETLVFKKCTTEEAIPTKKLLFVKKKCATEDKISCLKKPLVLQTISEEKSLIKEPLSFKKKPSTEEEFFKELSVLPEKHTTQGEMSILNKPLALQKTPTEEESLLKETLVFKKCTTEEAIPTKKLLFVKKKCATEDKISCLKKPLVLQTISEEKSLIKEPLSFKKKPTIEEELLFKESSVLPEKHTTQGEVALVKKPWTLQKNIHSKDGFLREPVSFRGKHTTNEADSSEEPLYLKKKRYTAQIMMSICQEMLDLQNMIGKDKHSFVMEPVAFRKKSSTDKEILCQDPPVLKEEHTTLKEVSHSRKPLALQEKTTTEEESYIKEPLKKQPTTEGKFLFQEQFSLHVKPTNKNKSLFWKALNMQNKTEIKEDPLKKLLTSQEKSTTKESSLLKEPLVLRKKVSTEATTSIVSQLSLKKKPTAQEEMFLLKKQLSLQENIASKEDFLIKQPLALQQKPSIEKESITEELALQGKLTINEAFPVKMFSLNEKPTTGQELSFEKPLVLQDNSTQKENTFPKEFAIQVETSSHGFNTAPKSRTGMSSSGTMSSVRKFNTTKKSSACKSSFNKLFSSWGKRSHKEVTILEEIDGSHCDPFVNLIYAKDIFRYMKGREDIFILRKYMKKQTDICSDMRAVLVNWLVEVQVAFELNHETLYLAVKLVDHYLMKKICKKEKLQLLGSTAFLIAAKFVEPHPPGVNDFLYLCNDAYQRDEMLAMEISILQTLKFDINIPVAYDFLRSYSVSLRVNMSAAILSRFICELTLQEYDYIQEKASKLAAGSFLLALHMKKLGYMVPFLEYHTGYTTSDLYPLVKKLNMLLLSLHSCDNSLKSVLSKYSHQLFFEVTSTPPLDMLKLEEIMKFSSF